ncbi:MAG: T9SS type A sorting domain-containing protein [Chitinophagales bacterium]
MKSIFSFIIITLFLAFQTSAETEKYRLMWRDDPSTTICIGWVQNGGDTATVYFDTTDHDGNLAAFKDSFSVDRFVSHKGMDHRFSRISGLQPNTAYYFYIEDADGSSDIFWFKTAPDNSYETLSIIAGGDSRNNRTPRQKANRLVSKLRPHAVLFGGDMTDDNTDAEWKEWLDDWQLTIGEDGRMIPIIAARGNHEFSNADIIDIFDTPGGDVYYALNFGGDLLRAYTLNSMIFSGNAQNNWLENDLSTNSQVIWKMAQYHFPMRPHTSGKFDNQLQYSSWAQSFYDHHLQLAVECDAHTVKTTWPIIPDSGPNHDEGFLRDDVNGTVYTGEGCWGAPLRDNDDDKSWTRSSGKFNQFKWILIDRYKIELRTIKVDNGDSVGTLNDHDIRRAPANLDVWDPGNGDTVVIIKNSDLSAPGISLIEPVDYSLFPNLDPINIEASVEDNNSVGIQKVEFFVDGEKIDSIAGGASPYNTQWTPPDFGEYIIKARVEDSLGEYMTKSSLITVDKSISIDDPTEELEYTLSPNPVSNRLFISCKNCENTPDHIRIYDISSKMIKNYTVLNEQNNILNLNFLDSGIYIVEINSKSVTFSSKIVKL